MSLFSKNSESGAQTATIECFLCDGAIKYKEGFTNNYKEHLSKKHHVKSGVDLIVQETLKKQFSSSPAPDTDKDLSTGKVPENEVKKVRLLWFRGCEYQCQICQEMCYDVQILINHINWKHEDSDDYIKKFKSFESKASYISCKICNTRIKRNFQSVDGHLINEHPGEDVFTYSKMFGLSEYEIAAKKNEKQVEGSVEMSSLKKQRLETSKEEVKEGSKTKTTSSNYDIKHKRESDKENEKIDAATTNVHVSLWANRSLIACNSCEREFKNMDEAKNHVIKNHCDGVKEKFYKMEKPLRVSEKFHDCKLCKRQIKWQKRYLEGHFQKKHNKMTLCNYYTTYISKKRKSVSSKGQSMKKTHSSGTKQTTCLAENVTQSQPNDVRLTPEQTDFSTPNQKDINAETTNDIGNDVTTLSKHQSDVGTLTDLQNSSLKGLETQSNDQSNLDTLPDQHSYAKSPWKREDLWRVWAKSGGSFVCKECGKTYLYFCNCANHLESVHQIEKSWHERFIYSSFKAHKCKICQAQVTWNLPELAPHIKTHKLSLKSYYEKFIAKPNLQDSLLKGSETQEEEAENRSINQEQRSKQGEGGQGNNEIILEKTDGCNNSPDESLGNDKVVLGTDEAEEHTSDALDFSSTWPDGCIYHCALCYSRFVTRKSIEEHVAVHNLDYQHYLNIHGDPAIVTNIFKCKICSVPMMHERKDIESHLLEQHNICLNQFFDKYVNKRSDK